MQQRFQIPNVATYITDPNKHSQYIAMPPFLPIRHSTRGLGRRIRRGRGITNTMQNSVKNPILRTVRWPYHKMPFYGRGKPNLHLRANAYSESDNRRLFLSTLPKTPNGVMRVPGYVKPTLVTRAYVV